MDAGTNPAPLRRALLLVGGAIAIALLLAALVPRATAGGSAPFAEGHLWRISKAGVADSYVLGTIHLADPRIAGIPPPALDAVSYTHLTLPTTPYV